eukprot:1394959-Amorphochlora_amoeboformis.AAC.2
MSLRMTLEGSTLSDFIAPAAKSVIWATGSSGSRVDANLHCGVCLRVLGNKRIWQFTSSSNIRPSTLRDFYTSKGLFALIAKKYEC